MNQFNPSPRPALTPREREILDFILAASSNKLTAYELGISQRTVEVHRSRIFQKMGVRNAVELIALVYQHAVSGSGSTPAPQTPSVRSTRPTIHEPAARRFGIPSYPQRCRSCGNPVHRPPSFDEPLAPELAPSPPTPDRA